MPKDLRERVNKVWLDEVKIIPPSVWLLLKVRDRSYKERDHFVVRDYVEFNPDTVKEMG